MDLMTRRRALLAQVESGVIATATGNPISFITDIVKPLKSLVIPFSSSGSGRSSITIKKNDGINIWDEVTEKGYWNVNTGAKVDSNNYLRCANYISVQPNTDYCFVAPNRAFQRTFLFLDSSKNVIMYDSYGYNPPKLTTPNNCYYITFYVNDLYGSTYANDISVNYPVTETTYHPYYAITKLVSFIDPTTGNPLTVYNGTLTIDAQGNATLIADGNDYQLSNVGQITTIIGTNSILTDTEGVNIAEYWIQNT